MVFNGPGSSRLGLLASWQGRSYPAKTAQLCDEITAHSSSILSVALPSGLELADNIKSLHASQPMVLLGSFGMVCQLHCSYKKSVGTTLWPRYINRLCHRLPGPYNTSWRLFGAISRWQYYMQYRGWLSPIPGSCWEPLRALETSSPAARCSGRPAERMLLCYQRHASRWLHCTAVQCRPDSVRHCWHVAVQLSEISELFSTVAVGHSVPKSVAANTLSPGQCTTG